MDRQRNLRSKFNQLCRYRHHCLNARCPFAHDPEELEFRPRPVGYRPEACRYATLENCPRNGVCWDLHYDDVDYHGPRAYIRGLRAERSASRPSANGHWLHQQPARPPLAHEGLGSPALSSPPYHGSPPPRPPNPAIPQHHRPPGLAIPQPHGLPFRPPGLAIPQPHGLPYQPPGPSAYGHWNAEQPAFAWVPYFFAWFPLVHESFAPPALPPPPYQANPQLHGFAQHPANHAILQPYGLFHPPPGHANQWHPLAQGLASAQPPPHGNARQQPDGVYQHPPDHAISQPHRFPYQAPGHPNP